jgi:acyl transferase domain-containing protein
MNYLPFPPRHYINHTGANSATSQTLCCSYTTKRTTTGAHLRRDTVTGEQQYVEETSKNVSRTLLVCSAADKATAQRTTAALSTYVNASTRSCHHSSTDLAFTLSSRRSHFPWRTFSVLETIGSHAKLQQTIQEPVRVQKGNKAQIAFVFTGQGAQYLGMGTALLEYPVFQHTLALFNEALSQIRCEWNIFGMPYCLKSMQICN